MTKKKKSKAERLTDSIPGIQRRVDELAPEVREFARNPRGGTSLVILLTVIDGLEQEIQDFRNIAEEEEETEEETQRSD